MTRIIEGAKPTTVNLGPAQQAIVEYYMQLYGVSKGSVIRGTINTFAVLDQTFDRNDFLRFAAEFVARASPEDKADAELMQAGAKVFVEEWKRLAETAISVEGALGARA